MPKPQPALTRIFVARVLLLVIYCLAYACRPAHPESVRDGQGVTYSVFWPLAWLCER